MARDQRPGVSLAELPEALPAITFFTVAPFFGVEEATRVAALPPGGTAAARG